MNVLVTGGARRIGAAIVRHLADAGHRVVVHHHHAVERDDVPGAIGHVVGDLGDAESTLGLIDAARSMLGGPVEGLVNNASLFAYDSFPLRDYALLDRHMHVNLGAPLVLASAMAAQDDLEEGAIVNLLDQKVGNLNPDFLTYSCSKLALDGTTVMMAQALAPRIRVNAVSPGLTLPSLDQSDAEFEAVASQNLLRRPVGTVAIAAAVAHLLTCRGITGQNVFVDNGQRFLKRDGDVMFDQRERPHG